MWSPSYYVGTAGHVSAETIERYITEPQVRRNSNLLVALSKPLNYQ